MRREELYLTDIVDAATIGRFMETCDWLEGRAAVCSPE